MNRLDRQAEVQPNQQLQQLRTIVNDIRQGQTFGGSDVRMYSLNNGSGGYTADITITNLTSTTSQGIVVTVTPLASNKVTLTAPMLQLGFYVTSSPSGAGSYYSQTSMQPSGGSQQVQLWFLAQSTTVTQMNVFVTVWSLVPISYTVAHL